ncbi:hypothetical protein ABZ705_28160 [Streptomyces sp. NPDC006984]|uniref:hypothetical protein n=1 Tax=Streptomyces sp. NPDC006984 TaxID=3155463 RepID=UPI0033CD3184
MGRPDQRADWNYFNSAFLRVWIGKSVAGPDPVVRSGTYTGIESRLETSNYWGNYNGSYKTPTISSTKAYADAQVRLDWRNDGKGTQVHNYTASPRV